MKENKKEIIVIFILAILLLTLIVFSTEFEELLNLVFTSKNTGGSRTPLSTYFIEHIWMVFLSSMIAIVIGLTLGIFVTTSYGAEFKELLLKVASFGQSFPSPALLALTVPILGYGIEGALIALVVYALMPIIYNVVIGIEEVPKDVIDAAKGMGMTEFEIYLNVKIPLALNVILGGIRTALVINISAATLTAAIGAGGLGVLVVNGVRTFDMVLILEGSIPVTLLAIIVDLTLKQIRFYYSDLTS